MTVRVIDDHLSLRMSTFFITWAPSTCGFKVSYSFLSTAERHRQATSSFSIFLASLLAAFSWEGSQTGLFLPVHLFHLHKQKFFAPAHAQIVCRWGRKPALLVSILASSGGELIGAFMPEFWSYAASRWPPSLDPERAENSSKGPQKADHIPSTQVCDRHWSVKNRGTRKSAF